MTEGKDNNDSTEDRAYAVGVALGRQGPCPVTIRLAELREAVGAHYGPKAIDAMERGYADGRRQSARKP